MVSWIKEHIAAHQWPAIVNHFTELNLLPSKKHDGKCPNPDCGGEKDTTRFRFDNYRGEGDFWCRYCAKKGGDGIALIMMVTGWGFLDTEGKIAAFLGLTKKAAAKPRPVLDKHDRNVEDIWEAALSITLSDPAGVYLTRTRCLPWKHFPRHLRYLPRAMQYGRKDGLILYHPALVALVKRPGRHWTLHFTYLTPLGEKISRATMPGGDFPDGGYVELGDMVEEGGVAESLEDAASIPALIGMVCWNCLNTTSLAKFTPPEGMKRLVIFGQRDVNYAGLAAGSALAHRLKTSAKSKHMQIDLLLPRHVKDWNDLLVSRGIATCMHE